LSRPEPGPEPYDVEYTAVGDRSLVARVYRPEGPGPFPGAVEIHGGAWNGLDHLADDALNRELARRGVFVAALEFRQGAEGAFPASVRDVVAGIAWLRENRERFSLSRIGALGNSSGGHQAMLAALMPSEPQLTDAAASAATALDFVVLCWPVLDPVARYEWARAGGNRPDLVVKHLDYWGDVETMAVGSPQHIVAESRYRHLPPVLIVQGDQDENLPPAMVPAFVDAYRGAGGEIVPALFEGRSHNFIIRDFDAAASRRAVDVIVQFIRTDRQVA
jgi:acetyl esterase